MSYEQYEDTDSSSQEWTWPQAVLALAMIAVVGLALLNAAWPLW